MTTDVVEEDAEVADGRAAPPVKARRRLSRLAKVLCLAFVIVIGAAVAGFLNFAERVAELRVPPDTVKGDGIVVLTGGYLRIEHALDLLRRGAGQRLLISGVNPMTTGAEIRKLTGSTKTLFECCVDIGHDAIDTVGNANETARWIHERGYKRVLLVTNNYHMPRSLLELRRVDPNTEFIPYPVINTDLNRRNWLNNSEVVRSLVSEYAKFSLASLRSMVGAVTETGLRTDRARANDDMATADDAQQSAPPKR